MNHLGIKYVNYMSKLHINIIGTKFEPLINDKLKGIL